MNLDQTILNILKTLGVSEVKLGNVTFFVDLDGPWVGELSHDIPMSKWDSGAITNSIVELTFKG